MKLLDCQGEARRQWVRLGLGKSNIRFEYLIRPFEIEHSRPINQSSNSIVEYSSALVELKLFTLDQSEWRISYEKNFQKYRLNLILEIKSKQL